MKIAAALLALGLSVGAWASRVEVDVNGMTCGMCVNAITKELQATEKAENINVSLDKKKASFSEVKGKKISDAEIKAAIAKAGYQASKIHRY